MDVVEFGAGQCVSALLKEHGIHSVLQLCLTVQGHFASFKGPTDMLGREKTNRIPTHNKELAAPKLILTFFMTHTYHGISALHAQLRINAHFDLRQMPVLSSLLLKLLLQSLFFVTEFSFAFDRLIYQTSFTFR